MYIRNVFLGLCFISLVLVSCAPKVYSPGIVSYEESRGKNIIVLRSDEYGSTSDEATLNAEKAAIKQMIFEGVANSSLSRGMTTEGRDIEKEHQQYFSNFFDQNGYRKFVTCSEVIKSEDLGRKKFHNTIKVCIAYENLRKDLEKNDIIKKLGF